MFDPNGLTAGEIRARAHADAEALLGAYPDVRDPLEFARLLGCEVWRAELPDGELGRVILDGPGARLYYADLLDPEMRQVVVAALIGRLNLVGPPGDWSSEYAGSLTAGHVYSRAFAASLLLNPAAPLLGLPAGFVRSALA